MKQTNDPKTLKHCETLEAVSIEKAQRMFKTILKRTLREALEKWIDKMDEAEGITLTMHKAFFECQCNLTTGYMRRVRGREGKPHVQTIQEILTEHGPMHVSDIVYHASQKGVPFRGKKKPEQVARDKMANSKRFVLHGDNVWGVKVRERLS